MSSPPTTFGSDTAERSALDAGDLIELPPSGVPSGRRAALRDAPPGGLAAARRRATLALARLRADRARMAAIGDCWRALVLSRLVVWIAGVSAVLALGLTVKTSAFDPAGTTSGFGWLGDRLIAPAARWDSAWYLTIARSGYQAALGLTVSSYHGLFAVAEPGYARGLGVSSRAAFFPLYPLLIATVGHAGVPLALAGILISVGGPGGRALWPAPAHHAGVSRPGSPARRIGRARA